MVIYMMMTLKQRKIKFKPRIKMNHNHNIYILGKIFPYNVG